MSVESKLRFLAGTLGSGLALLSTLPAFAESGANILNLDPVVLSRSFSSGELVFGPEVQIPCPDFARSFSFTSLSGGEAVDFQIISAQLNQQAGKRTNPLYVRANIENGTYSAESRVDCFLSVDSSGNPISSTVVRASVQLTD